MKKYKDELRRLAWGTDAGFYRLVPREVILSETEEDIISVLQKAHSEGRPVTFRAAGTSLSGQSISDSILLVAGKGWENWSYDENNCQVRLQPGIVGGKVNSILAKYGRRFGPDPASVGSAMVGGIVGNNASGMSCGTHDNSDHLLRSARIILSDGTLLDTGSEESRNSFMQSHPEIIRGIESLRDEVRSDAALSERIRHKYSIKNVTGLNIRPLLAYDDPFEIIAHLMVGSEGTLGFLAEVTMDTVPMPRFKASAMAYFDSITDAAEAVVAIRDLDINAAELLDRRSLASVGDKGGDTALLIEVTGSSETELQQRIDAVTDVLGGSVNFTSDPDVTARYWAIRSGIFPTVGGLRKEGTTCLIEDVAFHIEDLPHATADLSELLDRHGYDDSCIYGHALAGNFHFIINQSFDSEAEVRRYEAMIRDAAHIVVEKYDGSLKAEHGTGRNMAPFVEYEWGTAAFAVMKRIKMLFDPKGILNPGVIFNDDPDCFIKNFKKLPVLKPTPGADADTIKAYTQLNKCIECGFCEVNCVSCGFTLSSRQRVVLQREMASCTPGRRRMLEKQYRYPGNVTCAGDGLCSTSCPMGINIADMTHEIRRQTAGRLEKGAWNMAADHFGGTKNCLRALLWTADIARKTIGSKAMGGLCRELHKVGVPLWTPSIPGPVNAASLVRRMTLTSEETRPKVVYFPSCFNQMMGIAEGKAPLVEEMKSLLDKAGYDLIFPEKMDSLCCGTIWESKGMPETADRKTAELEAALLKASEGGRWPVLCDQSPCVHRMKKKITGMEICEPAEFIYKYLKDRLIFTKTEDTVAVHLTCSTRLMKTGDALIALARMCCSNVIVPEDVGCCGFAGDKGMTHPELNSWALRKLRGQVADASEGYSNSRSCEIGLATNSGKPYSSIVYLVNSHTSKR